MTRKNQFKQVYRSLYPESFQNADNVYYGQQCIEDALIQLQSCYYKEDVTGSKIVDHMLINVTKHLNHPNCSLYIMVFDKPKFVPKIKGIEHKRRQNFDVIPAPDPEVDTVYFPLETVIPFPVKSVMVNRKARRRAISEIVNAITKFFYPAAGKTLIIDGGTEDENDPPLVISCSSAAPGEENRIENLTQCVNMLHATFTTVCSEKNVTKPIELANKVGEGDLFYLHYIHQLIQKHNNRRLNQGILAKDDPVYVDVITDDTDFIPLSFSIVPQLEKSNMHVNLRFKPREDSSGKYKPKATDRLESLNVMLVRHLASQLEHIYSFSLPSIIAIMVSCGNDYVDGYGGLVPNKVLITSCKHSRFIGEMVLVEKGSGEWKLQADAYLRFIKTLYFEKHKTGILKEFPKAGRDGKWLGIPWDVLRKIIQKNNPRRTYAWIPSNAVLYNRFLRLSLNLILITKEYASTDGNKIDDICLNYGYSLIDPQQPLSFVNVQLSEQTNQEIPLYFNTLLCE